jgi:hypothetical protein
MAAKARSTVAGNGGAGGVVARVRFRETEAVKRKKMSFFMKVLLLFE